MANENILVVDDDVILLSLLKEIFERDGYSIATATSAHDAQIELEKNPPDMIILDIMLPDTDGYALLESIRENPEWQFIPVIFLSSRNNMEDKLKGLRLGVMDYLTKPFDREELKARVRNILDFHQLKTQKGIKNGQNSQERLIDFMSQRGVKSLIPRVCREAKLGYEYPEAARILNPEELGGEIYILESMARGNLLERVFYDTIHICNSCGHHDLNFREVCPHCSFADIDLSALVTCGHCQYRGLEEKYRTEYGMQCPQCLNSLEEGTADFKRSTSSLHSCNGCQSKFTQPAINCRCMNCDHKFDVTSALVRKIYAYRLMSRSPAKLSPDTPILEVPDAKSLFDERFGDSDLHFLDKDAFHERAVQELEDQVNLETGITLAHLRSQSFRNPYDLPPELLAGRLDLLLPAFDGILRAYDVLTMQPSGNFLLLLPKTPRHIATIVLNRLEQQLERTDFDGEWQIDSASAPEDGASIDTLYATLSVEQLTSAVVMQN